MPTRNREHGMATPLPVNRLSHSAVPIVGECGRHRCPHPKCPPPILDARNPRATGSIVFAANRIQRRILEHDGLAADRISGDHNFPYGPPVRRTRPSSNVSAAHQLATDHNLPNVAPVCGSSSHSNVSAADTDARILYFAKFSPNRSPAADVRRSVVSRLLNSYRSK